MLNTASAPHSAVRFARQGLLFGSYAGYRYRTATQYVSSVPDVAQMEGNFSENTPSVDPTDSPTAASDCKNAPTAADNAAIQFWVCNRATGLPYANNTLPKSALDPTVQNVLKYLANGNLTGPIANTGHLTQNGQPGVIVGDNKYTHREYDSLPQNNDEY